MIYVTVRRSIVLSGERHISSSVEQFISFQSLEYYKVMTAKIPFLRESEKLEIWLQKSEN